MPSRINKYRVMWIWVCFDLPTATREDGKEAALFRKSLIEDGFSMFQFSIYIRHCTSHENARMHISRVNAFIPPKGKVCIMSLTDKQFGDMQILYGHKYLSAPPEEKQLELF